MMLTEQIKQQIDKQGGLISFREFMALCLYTPNLGYYTSTNPIFGQDGDFITAPTLSPLFGATIANQIADLFTEQYNILEFGAGNGKLALDVLQRLQALDALPEQYFILELSAHLQVLQQQTLKAYPELYQRCHWLTALPTTPIKGIVLANEVLDAMPVNLFRIGEQQIVEEGFVAFEQDKFICRWLPAENLTIKQALTDIEPLPVGYQSEVNLSIKPWLASISHILQQGLVLLIDYGFAKREYYHPDRHTGTLMCHFQHKAHPDPFIHIGQQDITAHVDFTAVADAAFEEGFSISGYTNQAAFLISNGIVELSQTLVEADRLKANNAIKTLTMPQEMGELFKVMALTKALGETDLKGFSLMDMCHKL